MTLGSTHSEKWPKGISGCRCNRTSLGFNFFHCGFTENASNPNSAFSWAAKILAAVTILVRCLPFWFGAILDPSSSGIDGRYNVVARGIFVVCLPVSRTARQAVNQ